MITIILLISIVVIPIVGYNLFGHLRKSAKPRRTIYEYVLVVAMVISTLLFAFSWMMNADDYYTAIDIVDGGYTPIASTHVFTLIFFFVAALAAILALWLKQEKLPPLIFVIAIVFVVIGILIGLVFLTQVSSNTENGSGGLLFALMPLTYIIIALSVLMKVTEQAQVCATDRQYRNKFINNLNQWIVKSGSYSLWVLLLFLPVMIIVISVLMLFGQDYNSLTKVFTETTTWTFSQQTHPPFLDHKGHYLCTVAVCGSPRLVKPIRLGIRHGNEIIVNRQLLIANAFEELLQDGAPNLHRWIRAKYDQYGYPLSKRITTANKSNLVYILMKPLEYTFLMVLYLCCSAPEEKINRQYTLK